MLYLFWISAQAGPSPDLWPVVFELSSWLFQLSLGDGGLYTEQFGAQLEFKVGVDRPE